MLFCNYKTVVVQTDKDGKKHKAQGNRRVMYTQHHPCWDAKNRYGLPEEIPMEYAQIAQIFSNSEFGMRNSEFMCAATAAVFQLYQILICPAKRDSEIPNSEFIIPN